MPDTTSSMSSIPIPPEQVDILTIVYNKAEARIEKEVVNIEEAWYMQEGRKSNILIGELSAALASLYSAHTALIMQHKLSIGAMYDTTTQAEEKLQKLLTGGN